jgi:hypothetical protein
MTPPPKIEALDIGLGDSLALYGYQISPSGDSFDLHLIWTAHHTVATDYTVFVHLIDSSGAIAQQRDVMPVENSYPTSLWLAGEYVSDSHHFADLPPGDYSLRVGLYDQSTGTRLQRSDGSGDSIALGTVSLP